MEAIKADLNRSLGFCMTATQPGCRMTGSPFTLVGMSQSAMDSNRSIGSVQPDVDSTANSLLDAADWHADRTCPPDVAGLWKRMCCVRRKRQRGSCEVFGLPRSSRSPTNWPRASCRGGGLLPLRAISGNRGGTRASHLPDRDEPAGDSGAVLSTPQLNAPVATDPQDLIFDHRVRGGAAHTVDGWSSCPTVRFVMGSARNRHLRNCTRTSGLGQLVRLIS